VRGPREDYAKVRRKSNTPRPRINPNFYALLCTESWGRGGDDRAGDVGLDRESNYYPRARITIRMIIKADGPEP
jgi:hypothetical protein